MHPIIDILEVLNHHHELFIVQYLDMQQGFSKATIDVSGFGLGDSPHRHPETPSHPTTSGIPFTGYSRLTILYSVMITV